MTKKDVAVIGGAFDPVHNGHIMMADYLSKNYIVDEVLMLPSYASPLKDEKKMTSYEDRINMLALGTKDIGRVSISRIEEDYYKTHQTKTYTYNILKELEKKYLNIKIHFIVGFDCIKDISLWQNYLDLLNEYEFYIFDRDDSIFKTKEQKKYYLDNLGKKQNIKFYYEIMDCKIPTISSTKIRELFNDKNKNHDEILKYIPVTVYNYIVLNNLYE